MTTAANFFQDVRTFMRQTECKCGTPKDPGPSKLSEPSTQLQS